MECCGSDSVPDEYGSETDDDDNLVKVEAALESTNNQHELVEKNMDRMEEGSSDPDDMAIRPQSVDSLNSSNKSHRKRPRKSSVPKRIFDKAVKLEKLTENTTDNIIKPDIKTGETGETSDSQVEDEMYMIDTDIEGDDTDSESDKPNKGKGKKKYKYKKKYIARDHGVEVPKPVVIDTPDGKPMEVLYCKLCNKECKSKSSYVAHYKACSDPSTTPDGKHVCEICSKPYGTRRNLSRHMKMHFGDDRLRCQVCGRQFTEMKSLKGHLMIHTGEKPFPCSVCGLKFRDQSTRRKHERRHGDNKPYSCEICGKGFAQGVDLRKHLKIHDPYENREFRCDQCDKAYYLVAQLKRHLRTHTGEKPYECQYCGKFYSDQANLRKHTSTHDGACLKNFQCDLCGDTFLFQCRLDEHMRRHNNVRNFKCDLCDRSFFTASNLSKHRTTHEPKESVINLRCARCEKEFDDIDSLKQHRKTHKPIKKEQCAFCGKGFVTLWVLNRHISVCKAKKHIENGVTSKVKEEMVDKSYNDNAESGSDDCNQRKAFKTKNKRTAVNAGTKSKSENKIEVLINEQPDIPLNNFMSNYAGFVNAFSHTGTQF